MNRIETKIFSGTREEIVQEINEFINGRPAEIGPLTECSRPYYYCVVHILDNAQLEDSPTEQIKTKYIYKYDPIQVTSPTVRWWEQPKYWVSTTTTDCVNNKYSCTKNNMNDVDYFNDMQDNTNVNINIQNNNDLSSDFDPNNYEKIIDEYGEPPDYEVKSFTALALTTAPKGYSNIIKTFGQPMVSGKLSAQWYKNNVVTVKIPFTMRYAYNTKQMITRVSIHKLLASKFLKTLTDVYDGARLEVKKTFGYNKTSAFYDVETMKYLQKNNLDLFGGTFCFRTKRGSNELSLHSFAIAIDIDPANNPMGAKKTTFPNWFIKVWKDNGWTWGGDWKTKDPMHFQFASGA